MLKKTTTKRKTKNPENPTPENPSAVEIKLILSMLYRLVSPLKSLSTQMVDGIAYVRPEDIAYITTTTNNRVLIYDLTGAEFLRFDSLNDLEKILGPDPRCYRRINTDPGAGENGPTSLHCGNLGLIASVRAFPLVAAFGFWWAWFSRQVGQKLTGGTTLASFVPTSLLSSTFMP